MSSPDFGTGIKVTDVIGDSLMAFYESGIVQFVVEDERLTERYAVSDLSHKDAAVLREWLNSLDLDG